VVEDFDAYESANPVLRYLAILGAARDFGVPPAEIERIRRRFDPHTGSPRELADALADALPPWQIAA
jgi:hypothetical protein